MKFHAWALMVATGVLSGCQDDAPSPYNPGDIVTHKIMDVEAVVTLCELDGCWVSMPTERRFWPLVAISD